MPFGMKNAACTFQQLMNRVICGLEGTEIYKDDLVIHSNDWRTHLVRLKKVFEALRAAGLVVNLSKCEFVKAKKPFTVAVDASDVGIGGVLFQRHEDGEVRPVSYFSRKLLDAERRATDTKAQLLLSVEAMVARGIAEGEDLARDMIGGSSDDENSLDEKKTRVSNNPCVAVKPDPVQCVGNPENLDLSIICKKIELLKVQFEENERARRHELEMAKINLDLARLRANPDFNSTPTGPSSDRFNISVALKLVPVFDESNVLEFFKAFERVATRLSWPTEMWTVLIQCSCVIDSKVVRVNFLRDTGSARSLVLSRVLKDVGVNSGNYVVLGGFPDTVVSAPLVEVEAFFPGYHKVTELAVVEKLPIPGIDGILGNDMLDAQGYEIFPIVSVTASPVKFSHELLEVSHKKELNVGEFVEDLRRRLSAAWKFAQDNLVLSQASMKRNYDKKSKTRSFEPGELVLVLSTDSDNLLEPRYKGPWKVLRKLSDVNYEVEAPGTK
ncbi:uncharacterized protein [Palaemon carinicauda]|uniref:uncharacterized protein n=1 Tax=Palaemon carinicauda TaxID=392227 RepID=UPI0035B618C0